ncbi:MAG: hypothetical protein AB1813_28400, partial [Verrucomicrobiota bacterium]
MHADVVSGSTAIVNARQEALQSAALWSALAERSGDSALAAPACGGLSDAYGDGQSGVALTLCHRSPKVVGDGARLVALQTAALWSALAERSDDSALAAPACGGFSGAYGMGQSGVALTLCHRSPKSGWMAERVWWRCKPPHYGVRWQNE